MKEGCTLSGGIGNLGINKNRQLTIALCGNPNCGKTTLFNAITQSHQAVGNWPGVTVTKIEGTASFAGQDLRVIDLPGVYSLTAFSPEEIAVRDFLLKHSCDVIINIVDTTNLERNLYLTTQLLELNIPTVLALNMSDEAAQKGIQIDLEKLTRHSGLPAVAIAANRKQGLKELLNTTLGIANAKSVKRNYINTSFSSSITSAISAVQRAIETEAKIAELYDSSWLAVKLLEQDPYCDKLLDTLTKNPENIREQVVRQSELLLKRFNDTPDVIMANERYSRISKIINAAYNLKNSSEISITDRIDAVVTNRVLGIPILFGLLWLMFQATFTLGAYPTAWIESFLTLLMEQLNVLLPSSLIKAMVVDGILAGVGGVLVFLPNILILFFFIALFEDSGYMARAAFVMDRVMHTLGLHGKSFIPIIMGFGCNVPAIMAARTLENRSDRMITILINPLVSCSARLPIYVLLAGAFFGAQAGNVIFGLYVAGIFLAIAAGQLLRKTLFRGQSAPFVMELPPYRLPLMKNLLSQIWSKAKLFLRKVGGIILAASILMWFLSNFPDSSVNTEIIPSESAVAEQTLSTIKSERPSYAEQLGRALEPVVAPLGFDWRGAVALISGVAAKELVVASFSVLYQVSEDDEASFMARISQSMTPLSAVAFMLFTLIYIPCLGTLGVMYRELGSLRWTLFGVGYSLLLAWALSFVVYQGGRALGLGV